MAHYSPTSLVANDAKIDESVWVSDYARIDEQVVVGQKSTIGQGAIITGKTEIGDECQIYPYAVIGIAPQDLTYSGEETLTIVGSKNIIREFVTIHRGTIATGKTVIGDNNLLMAYTHIAHDCHIGSNVIISNASQLGGHIEIGDYATIGGMVAVHQFCRIGAYAMVGAVSKVTLDIPPFALADGNPAKVAGVNIVGLKRHNFLPERIEIIKKAFRILYFSKTNLSKAIDKLQSLHNDNTDIALITNFLKSTKRGISKRR